jgi:hypothetical protein
MARKALLFAIGRDSGGPRRSLNNYGKVLKTDLRRLLSETESP